MKLNVSNGNIKNYIDKNENYNNNFNVLKELKKNIVDMIDDDMKNNKVDILNYTSPKGDEILRKLLADIESKKHNKMITKEYIIITNGSQESINIIATMLRVQNKKMMMEEFR